MDLPHHSTTPPLHHPLLEVREVSKSFPGVRALTAVSLSLGRGEVVAVIGENGAGKSTLMKILAGVQTPDAGQVLVDGEPVTVNSVQAALKIANALSVNARVLIMDEPTSSLTGHEAEQLFDVVRDLRSRGISVLYISHRLGEVKELADRVVVLRDGKNAGELSREQVSHERMV